MATKKRTGKRVSGDPRKNAKDLSYKGKVPTYNREDDSMRVLVFSGSKTTVGFNSDVNLILNKMSKYWEKDLVKCYEEAPEWKQRAVREMISMRLGIYKDTLESFEDTIYVFLTQDVVSLSLEFKMPFEIGSLRWIESKHYGNILEAIKKFEAENEGCHVYHVAVAPSYIFKGEQDWAFLFVSENDYVPGPNIYENRIINKYCYMTGDVPKCTDEFGTVSFKNAFSGLVRVA